MNDTKTLNVVIFWHMHQPDYRDWRSGQFQLPWTYLHSIKDYVDMAAHIEECPSARAVVNFSPILLEQIDDYTQQIHRYFDSNKAIKDPVLHALVDPAPPTDYQYRSSLTKSCLRANDERMIKRFDQYKRLAEMAEWIYGHHDEVDYFNNQYIADLVVWYHLAWLGETVRRSDERVKQLIEKASGFSLQDRKLLLMIIGELMSGLFPRYKKLSDSGKVELSLNPYAHPIVPLLIDISSANQAMPDVKLPVVESYPGGLERSHWHMKKGLELFERHFECKPKGCWLSEGAISNEALGILDEYNISWTATGENVLNNSLLNYPQEHEESQSVSNNSAFKVGASPVNCFFRDDTLSDLIGFEYSDWHADDAVANLINALEHRANHADTQSEPLVSIILDGENAWEHYAENGYYFLSALYEKLVEHPQLKLQTFSEYLAKDATAQQLQGLTAGSWVYGTFSTWIGDEQKNRGWDMLTDAKHCYDRVMAKGILSIENQELAKRQLAICEASDWFWWFGDYNPAETVSDFERLFRMHLSNLYSILGEQAPGYLTEVFTRGVGKPLHGGVMRPGHE